MPPGKQVAPANPLIEVLALGAAALAALGSFLTWASGDAGFIEVSNGMDGDGMLTLPVALVFGDLVAPKPAGPAG